MNTANRIQGTPRYRWIFWPMLITISILSLLPSSSFEGINVSISDKLVHGAFYATLGLLVQYAYPKGRLLALGSLMGYSLLIECGQYYMPSRSFDWWDFAANSSGIVLAWLIYQALIVIKNRSRE